GKDTLWQPGTDHAGIATQAVVERQLAEEKKTRHDLGRDGFIERVWQWKEESGNMIVNQLHRLGTSPHWDRERFTMDEGLSEAVLKVFVDLYKDGLIYRDKRLVNWDVKLQTAISDLEVEQREVDGHLWYIRYPVEDEKVFITVATTRPETMLGDTAVAVHPEDERYKDLIGKNVLLPLTDRKIPIVGDEHSDPEKGSGAVKITPAHDFNDFDVGKRHQLEMINILDASGSLNENVPEKYQGLDRFEARKMIVNELDEMGLMEKIDDERHTVPYGDRSGVVLEPWLTDQWFVDAPKLAIPAIEAVEQDRTRFVPKNWEKTYFEWMRNIQPWCISRQIWWGHRIPAWYGPDGTIFVEHDEATAQKAADEHYGEAVELTRDTDVLDTWFSSALWPFSTLGWPENTDELKRYYPTDVLVTGFDIIFFWVARMMMMGLHFMKDVPFRTVYIHALVRDKNGEKMSKMKGNIIDPLELIDQFGADALRFTLAAMAAPGRDIKLNEERVVGYRNFATKIWNASRFLLMHGEEVPSGIFKAGFSPEPAGPDDQHILSKLNETIRYYHEQMAQYRFNDMAQSMYEFLWHQFCDWYLEYSKPILNGEDQAAREAVLRILHHVLSESLRLLHPLMPFITEELWHGVGYAETEGMLATGRLPEARSDEAMAESGIDPAQVAYVEAKHEIIRLGRALRADYNLNPSTDISFTLHPAADSPKERLEQDAKTIASLAGGGRLTVDPDFKPASAMPSHVGQLGTLYMPLEGLIDMNAEMERLTGQLDKVTEDIQRINKKLENKNFTEKAPPEVVDVQKERKVEQLEKKEKLEKVIETLSELIAS
ncbi:MAG: valine--tRNA ligase, partial [Verrucomicrobiota bacterium]